MFKVLAFLFPFSLYAMCDFPHNPAVYCLRYKLSGKAKEIKKFTPFKCEYDLQSADYFRPPNTYHFTKDLNKIKHYKFSKVSFKNSKRIEEPLKLLSPNCNLDPGGILVVSLSCYDTYENIPDFRIITNGKVKDKIFDPWVQKSLEFDCSNLTLQ